VEPGIYFVDHLLDQLLATPAVALFVKDPAKLQALRGSGGWRLEDSVLITPGGCRNLTRCPRTSGDVEAARAGTLKEPSQCTALLDLEKYLGYTC
jgi:Xaa-Pro dipeptidase